jgi:glycerol-1-phosphate dehydrogenase [NAD(P)+]
VSDPFSRDEWLEAIRRAPAMKEDFYTILSTRDTLPEAAALMKSDPWLRECFA